MISCVYTADKRKKNKIWKEGFVKVNGKFLFVYDEEKKKLCNIVYSDNVSEYETFRYLIYIENYSEIERKSFPEIAKESSKSPPVRTEEEILSILSSVEKESQKDL